MYTPKPLYQKTWFIVLMLFLFFPVGLFLLWTYGECTKKTKLIITGVFVVLCIFSVSTEPRTTQPITSVEKPAERPLTKSKEEPAEPPPIESKQEPAVQKNPIKKLYTIGLTPEQFKEKFNSVSISVKSKLLIGDLESDTGDVQNSFKYAFNDNLIIIGTVNKANGMIRDVSVLAQPSKDNMVHNANILLAFACMIGAVNPELETSERGEILDELGFFDKDGDLTNLNEKTIRGNIQYHVSFITGVGFMLNAQSIDDK